MNAQKTFLKAMIVGLLLIFASGCSSDIARLLGTYQMTIGPGEPPAVPGAELLVGAWVLELEDDSRFQVYLGDPGAGVKGSYLVTGNQITFTDEEGGLQCPGPGKYEWVLDGQTLTFTAVEDTCESRKFILTVHPWIK
jgi:hypothetical protein